MSDHNNFKFKSRYLPTINEGIYRCDNKSFKNLKQLLTITNHRVWCITEFHPLYVYNIVWV